MTSLNCSPIIIACNFDAAYAPHAAAMLLSAISCAPAVTKFRLHCLHDSSLPKEIGIQFHKIFSSHAPRVTVTLHEIPDQWVAGLPLLHFMPPGSMPPVMWYRVFLPDILVNETKVLYLDADTLVMDNLDNLWATDISGKAIAAVTNPSWDHEENWPARVGLPSREAYFNSGVMLLNLEWLRSKDMTRQIVQHGRENSAWTRYGDQDSLVALLHEHRVSLSPRWNLMRMMMLAPHAKRLFGRETILSAVKKPGIVHFEGFTKPWVDPSRHPYGRAYTRYANRLPWTVKHRGFNLNDIENFLIRHQWLGLHHRLRRLRAWIKI